MDQPGENSRDLRTLRQADPAEKDLEPDDVEDAIQRRGRRIFTTGIVTMTVTVVVSLAVAVLHSAAIPADTLLLVMLAIASLMATGGVLAGIGAAERSQRPARAMMRMLSRAVAGAAAQADRNFAMNTRLGAKADESAAQLEAIIGLLGEVVEHMPELKERIHWRGFNAAVREGFTDRGTGTNGPGGSRKRLGVVPSAGNDASS